MNWVWLAEIIFVLILVISCGEKHIQFDRYGGLDGYRGSNNSGYFRVEKIRNRWWFTTPDNHLFISFGANSINFNGDYVPTLGYSIFRHNLLAKFGGEDFLKWRNEVRKRFEILNFNTLGSWTDDGISVFADTIPYTINLALARRAVLRGVPVVNTGWWTGFPDVFDNSFEIVCDEIARESIEKNLFPPYPYPEADQVGGYMGWDRKNDPYLIGYFLENELNWFGDASFWEMKSYTLTDDFIALPSSFAGKMQWVSFLKSKYTLAELNDAYGTEFFSWDELLTLTSLPDDPQHPSIKEDKGEFLQEISDRFFSVTTEAIRRYDPNHLILCARFASDVPDEVLRSASRYCDVISINDYYITQNLISDSIFGEAEERWMRFYQITKEEVGGRPFILSEFGIRAWDSGNPNSWGAGWWVDYQEERAEYFAQVVRKLLFLESAGEYFVAGFHWFEWEDEPKLGRFDGENSNYGLNSIRDEPYLILQREIGNSIEEFYRLILGEESKKIESPSISLYETSSGVSIKMGGGENYEVVVSTARTFEGAETIIISTDKDEFILPLSSGLWWITARTARGNYWSRFSVPLSFEVAEKCGDFSSLFSWRNYRPFRIPDTSPGIAIMLPASEPSFTLENGVHFVFPATEPILFAVFTVNSYSRLNPIRGGEGVRLSLEAELCSQFYFENFQIEVYPLNTQNGEGVIAPSTAYIGIAFYNKEGDKVYDTGIPVSGVIDALTWNTLNLHISANVKSIEIYVDTSNPDVPLDQILAVGFRFYEG